MLIAEGGVSGEQLDPSVTGVSGVAGVTQCRRANPSHPQAARLQRDDLVARLLAIGRTSARRMSDETKHLDHARLLYDQKGLPS
jgi:antitoxin VapB